MALKSEFSVKRNLLEKAFAYPRGSDSIEPKISQLQNNNKFLNNEDTPDTGNFATK